MARIVSHESFRTLRACRQIGAVNCEMLRGLREMRESIQRTRVSLEQASRCLEDAVEEYARARQRLEQSNLHHRRVMKVVDRIMETSPVFRSLQ